MTRPTKKIYSLIWTCASILAGNALLAFAVEAFIVPHDLIMGGTTGLAIVLARVLPADTAAIVFILNGLLLILGGLVLGKKLVTTTLASTLLYPALLALMGRIPGIGSFTRDPLVAALFGGGLMGMSLGVVMRVGSSTGGMDIASLVLHRWTHIPVSVCVYVMDILVIGGQALFSKPEPILYALVLLVVQSLVLDRVMILGLAQIQLFAISQRYDELRRRILTELEAGATMVEIQTGAMQQRQKGVLCVIPRRKLYAATELIQSVDPAAFITITQVKEVRGRGFTLERSVQELDVD